MRSPRSERVLIPAVLVCAVACAAPWAFGATEPLWWALLSVACLAIAFPPLAAAAVRGGGPPSIPASTARIAAAVPLVALAGLVPIPGALRSLISPRCAEVLADADPSAASGWGPVSLDAHATLGAACVAAACAAAFWAVARGATREATARTVRAILIAGGVALAAFGLVYRLWDYDPQAIYWRVRLPDVASPFGPYVNRNHFAGAMLVFLGVAAGSALAAAAAGRRTAAAFATLAGLVPAVALAATTSRGACLGAAVGGVLLVLAARGRARRWGVVILVAGAGLLAAALAATGLLAEFAGRIHLVLEGREWNRVLVQADAVRVFLSAPLLGTGAGTFATVYPPFQTVPDDRFFGNAHSDWAQFLMETGLLGTAVIVLAVRDFLPRVRAALVDASPRRWLVLGPAAGCAALAVHGFADPNLHVPANALLFAVALALACGTADGGRAAG